MRRCTLFCATCAAVLLCCLKTHAISHSMAPVPISPQALAADPVLHNYQTWDLRVTVDPGETLGFTGMNAPLTQGAFYQSVLGAIAPAPQLWQVFPQVRFDTFVTQGADPDDDSTFIPPNVTSGFPEPPLPVIFTEDHLSIVWHSLPGPGIGPGTWTVARLTFTNDAVGTLVGHSFPRLGGTSPAQFSFPIPIPEPTAAGALVLLPLLARRRLR